MERTNFDDEMINKSNFYRNDKLFNVDDIDVNKIVFSKKDPYGKKAHLNTLLDIVTMMKLDHYV